MLLELKTWKAEAFSRLPFKLCGKSNSSKASTLMPVPPRSKTPGVSYNSRYTPSEPF